MLTEMVRGATEKIRLNYKLNGVPQLLAGYTIIYTWKMSPSDSDPALQITQTEHESDYESVLPITPALTKNLDLGIYQWEYVIVKPDGTRICRKKGMQGHIELTFNLDPIPEV